MSTDTHTLWYNTPATDWHAALPIGNGPLGAMVFGDPVAERIQITEESIWGGPPVPEMPPTAKAAIEEARQLIFDGKYADADSLIREKALAPRIAPRSQQPLGDLLIRFGRGWRPAETNDYHRELDLRRAVATSSWRIGETQTQAEVFCSASADVCIARYVASGPDKLNCTIQLRRESGASCSCLADDTLLLAGQATQNGQHLGTTFAGVLKVVASGGGGVSL